MEHSPQKIAGYRELREEEVHLMNEVKLLEAKWNGLIDRLRALDGVDQRQVSTAVTDGEAAFMRACRAIAQPTRLVSYVI